MHAIYRILLVIVLCCLSACGPVRFIKPLSKKQQALNVSLGGALIKKGNAILPIPFLTTTYGYGIDSTITGFGAVNITSALFGNFQTELGATFRVLKQNSYIPAISVTPVANIIYRNATAYKFYPQIDINAYWEYGLRKNYFYVGVSNWFELGRKAADELSQTHTWIFTPLIGHNFSGGGNWDFMLEAKVIAPHISNEKNVVEYKTPFKTCGAFGIYAGTTYKF